MTLPQALQLAVQHHQARRLGEAEALYRQILDAVPNHPDALHLLGLVAHQTGHHQPAVQLIRRAIAINPAEGRYLSNLGNVLSALGQLDEAIDAYRRYLALHPQDAGAWSNLGATLRIYGSLDEAESVLHRALTQQSGFAQAHNNLGLVYRQQGRFDEAAEAYRQALALKSDYPEALSNLAIIFKEQGLVDEAITHLRQALAVQPGAPAIYSNLILTLHFQPTLDLEVIAQELHLWQQRYAAPLESFIQPYPNDRTPNRRLRVGYMSPDLRDHVLGTNLWPLFAHHDVDQFEIYCYSDVVCPDRLTEAFRHRSHGWRSTAGMNDHELTALIRKDAIDILVDLSQHMAGNRLTLFARQPAPVQASFAGYPGSSGLKTVGHRITGRFLEPVGAASTNGERLHPIDTFWCYAPCGAEVEVVDLPASQNGFMTFGCLHHFGKVAERMLNLWGRLLQRVPRSRLLILAPQGSARTRTLEILGRAGVEPTRVEFLDSRPRLEYLRLYQQVDIILDTFPYNGHTTILDALWMGVPVVSLAGEVSVSRAGLSTLTLLGHPEWVAQSEDDYLKIAAELAANLPQLAELHATLRSRLEASLLMDGAHFARQIESAYREMWRDWCR